LIFFNHVGNSDKYSWGYSPEYKFFHSEALRNYHIGEEVYQFYGHLANWELLLEYGFILDDNSYDSILVNKSYLGNDPEDPVLELKEKLLRPYIEHKSGELLLFKNNAISKELLTASQIINSGEEDFIDGKLGPKTYITDYYMSIWFQAIYGEKLMRFPTALVDDLETMRTSAFTAMSLKAQMAFQLRVEEKQTLTDAIHFWSKYEQRLYEESIAEAKEEEESKNKQEL